MPDSELLKRRDEKLKCKWFIILNIFFRLFISHRGIQSENKDVSGLDSPLPMIASIPFVEREIKILHLSV